MKTFAIPSRQVSRLWTVTAIAALCLLGGRTQAGTLAPGNPTLISVPPARLAVQPSSAPAEDIRDIRPPYPIPSGWQWLVWTAGGLALAGLGYGAWRWRRRLGFRVKLPYELALERLEAARGLMQPEQARAFSFAVSEVVRQYIEECFPVRAAHRTTREFFVDLATNPNSPLVAHQRALSDFLQHCDLAKFARWILSGPQMEAMLQSARVFIVATGKPTADAPAVRPGGGPSAPATALPSVSTTPNPHAL